jgi:hypothetical protein
MSKNMKITPVEEVNYGLYIWHTADGKIVRDEEGNYLCIPATKGSVSKIKKLKEVAAHYGLGEGRAVWFSGHRQVTDDEYEMQKQRLEWGLIPDEYDLPALKEDIEQKRKMKIV